MSSLPFQQSVIYWVNLPQFILNYKQKFVNLILPHLLSIKSIINNQENSQVVNPIIIILTVVVVLTIVKNIWNSLFGKRFQTKQNPQSFELNNEVNDLKKQLKSLKNSFNELSKELNSTNFRSLSQVQIRQTSTTKTQPSFELLNNLLDLYTNSLNQNKSLINYVLESQFQVLTQLKKFKKLNKNSLSSSGKPSISTVRSKTSQKRAQIKDKSPIKLMNKFMSSQMKKIEVQSTEKSLKSQIPIKKPIKSILENTKTIEKNLIKPEVNLKKKLEQIPVIVPLPELRKNQIDEKSQKPKAVQEQVQKSQSIILPVTTMPKTPKVKNQSVLQAQTVIKQTKMTEVIQSSTQVHTKVELISSTEKKLTEIQQTITSRQQATFETQKLNPSELIVEQPVILVPPKLPQIKKIVPPSTKTGTKRPPPPPPKK